jgi:DNA repair exonuclease SbcCD ATPase subunit
MPDKDHNSGASGPILELDTSDPKYIGQAEKLFADSDKRMKPNTDYINSLSNRASDLKKALENNTAFSKQLREITEPYGKLSKQLSNLTKPFENIRKNLSGMTELLKVNSSFAALEDQISEQQKRIDSLRNPLSLPRINAKRPKLTTNMPDLRPPISHPNPHIQTNTQLSKIEDRLENFQEIALEAANIATGLQAAMAELLATFKNAAEQNDKATRLATWLAKIAVVVAFALPLMQIAYIEFWRAPKDSVANQQIIDELRGELAAIRHDQATVNNALTESLKRLSDNTVANGKNATAVLRDIENLLSKNLKSSSTAIPKN